MTTPTLSDQRNLACRRYKDAVDEYLAARSDLAALDRILDLPGFGGSAPMMVDLRHTTAAPDLQGAVTDGVRAAFERLSQS